MESANVVGYNNVNFNDSEDGGTRSPIFGMSFVPVSGVKAKLGDFKPADGEFACETDYIQVINPTTLINDRTFTYVDKTTADAVAADNDLEEGAFDEFIGWWDADVGVFEDGGLVNDYLVTPGEGFMGAFDSGNVINFTSSGSAPLESTSFVPNVDATRSPIFCSYIPREIPLKYLAPVNGQFACETDYIQVINATTLINDRTFTYVDKTTADAVAADNDLEEGAFDEFIGWWDADVGVFEDGGLVNDYPVMPGSAFMGAFDAGAEITFQLPSSTATLD